MFSSAFRRTTYAAAFRSSPAFSTSATASVKPSRLVKYGRRIAYTAGFVGLGYVVDNQFYASTFTRNFRTLYTCAIIVADYKFNFTQEKSAQIEDLHGRVAQRLFDLFTGNGGLYIKFGQAIGANAALLPKPMQLQFSRLFDDAPSLPFTTISRVLSAEFGGRPLTGPDGLFASFEEDAIASASIAQVHRAVLHDGTRVAVKIQKPAVAKQMEPDLLAFRGVLWAYEWYFELPTYFVVDFISDHLRQELDFEREAINGRKTSELLSQDNKLRGKVHVPRIYGEQSGKRVLTTEWIDGVRLSNREAIMALMGEGDAHRLPTASQSGYADDAASTTSTALPLGVNAPLKGGVKWVMRTMTEFFGAAIFRYGWVHADPHPGNFLLRPHPHPSYKGEPQLVLLDHGLYVRLNPKFQRQYAELWKGLLAADMNTVRRVAIEWGIGAPDVFASATLMRPMRVPKDGKKKSGETKQLSQYELSIKMKERLKSFLTDTDKMPKELVFIGRNMRMVQGNNQMFGSPVNRVKITAYAAADSLPRAQGLTIAARAREYLHQATFYMIMFAIDAAFVATQVKNWVLHRQKKRGFEDELEAQMAQMMKREYGVEVDPAMFEA
ncbi:unnamed protein product [Peniophora sp. CBMAI 1063]|nr:unnamed protein product [Peniophora sp. CBMAI 1063]